MFRDATYVTVMKPSSTDLSPLPLDMHSLIGHHFEQSRMNRPLNAAGKSTTLAANVLTASIVRALTTTNQSSGSLTR